MFYFLRIFLIFRVERALSDLYTAYSCVPHIIRDTDKITPKWCIVFEALINFQVYIHKRQNFEIRHESLEIYII